jgi:hypothetical protein
MGAFIAYLYLAHGINNFFVLAPNLTIYSKLITDFTPNTPKYVFKGIAEFAQQAPLIITGDNYDQMGAAVIDPPQGFAKDVRINIFNISKINSEVRGGKEPRIKRMRKVLGDSYFNHLANLPDLVLLMDESHRYRAQAGMRAINELKPLFGLEVTATPFVESGKGPVPFKNVVIDYPLARAMEDGFVKEPAAVTQRGFDARTHTPEAVEHGPKRNPRRLRRGQARQSLSGAEGSPNLCRRISGPLGWSSSIRHDGRQNAHRRFQRPRHRRPARDGRRRSEARHERSRGRFRRSRPGALIGSAFALARQPWTRARPQPARRCSAKNASTRRAYSSGAKAQRSTCVAPGTIHSRLGWTAAANSACDCASVVCRSASPAMTKTGARC